MKKKTNLIAITLWLLILTAISSEETNAAASASLSQARNGTDSIPINPMNWVTGNLGTGTAHYTEGMSAPYRCIMTGLTIGFQVTLIIGYDVMNGGKHAIDYLTHYDRVLPHNFGFHNTPEVIDPLNSSGLSAGTPFTTYAIPAPSSSGSPVSGQPTASFNSLAAGERIMTLYNGTIDSIYYVSEGNLNSASSETRMAIVFTPASATVVLAWGGHIGSRIDWGYTGSSNPNSAGGISGSPFHMRLVSWNLNNLGNQDRSLSGATVGAPPGSPLPVELILFDAYSSGNTNILNWATGSEFNSSYFSLQRSSSITNFETIAMVNGAGNSSVIRNYSWTDNHPLNGVCYYRLVQTDYDGMQRIFSIVSARKDESSYPLYFVNTYPNPFSDEFSVTYHSDNKTATLMEIVDINGRHVYSEILNTVKGTNHFKFRDTDSLRDGFYFISLSQAGNKPVAKMIIKK